MLQAQVVDNRVQEEAQSTGESEREREREGDLPIASPKSWLKYLASITAKKAFA
jgi:hypothetical protein